MTSLSQLMSGDAIWAILAAIILPSIAGIWWYIISKTSHLYSKIAEINNTLAERGAMIKQFERYTKHIDDTLAQHDLELRNREHEINFLFWELTKDKPNEQGQQTKRPSDRQSIRRPQ